MIIFGLSTSNRNSGPIAQPCPACEKQEQVGLRGFRYFHLFFVPVLPLGSKKGTTCGNCLHTRWGKEAREAVELDAMSDEKWARRPAWHYIGTAALFMLVAFLFFEGDTDREIRSAQAAEAPSVGDVWIVSMPDAVPAAETDYKYAVARVDEIADGQVFLGFSDWQYESWFTALRKAKTAVEINDPDYFTTTGLWFSAADLVDLESERGFIWAFASAEVD